MLRPVVFLTRTAKNRELDFKPLTIPFSHHIFFTDR